MNEIRIVARTNGKLLSMANQICELINDHKTVAVAGVNGMHEVAPIVRCKNCQHQDDLRYEVGGKFVCRKGHGWNTNDFFCADGEPRKPKDGDGK